MVNVRPRWRGGGVVHKVDDRCPNQYTVYAPRYNKSAVVAPIGMISAGDVVDRDSRGRRWGHHHNCRDIAGRPCPRSRAGANVRLRAVPCLLLLLRSASPPYTRQRRRFKPMQRLTAVEPSLMEVSSPSMVPLPSCTPGVPKRSEQTPFPLHGSAKHGCACVVVHMTAP